MTLEVRINEVDPFNHLKLFVVFRKLKFLYSKRDKEKSGSQPTENTANEEAPVKEFVFGEKLNDRVTINLTKNGESTSENGDNATASNSTKRKSYDAEDQDSKDETNETSETAAKTLWSTENNGDYFDPNENNENTLFKINCKLYLLEADKANWVERGYGILKVIDSNDDLNCNISRLNFKAFLYLSNIFSRS